MRRVERAAYSALPAGAGRHERGGIAAMAIGAARMTPGLVCMVNESVVVASEAAGAFCCASVADWAGAGAPCPA
jgi:hypothetical protein